MINNKKSHWLTMFLLLAAVGCSSTAAQDPGDATEPLVGTLKFLESYPEETDLNLPDFPEAAMEWPLELGKAQKSIDVASFYFSRIGDGKDSQAPEGVVDHLILTTETIARSAENGVQVRILGDSKFQKTYPELLEWFDDIEGIESRTIDVGSQWGGVLHAKYFLVDDKTLFVGSQNWDWRALGQIRELGALITHPKLADDLKRIFDLDWALAEGHPESHTKTREISPASEPEFIPFGNLPHARLETQDGSQVEAVLAASPAPGLPAGVPWDLPLLVELIDSATETVHLQLLSYNVSDREGRYFADLDTALRRAAARQVKVEILLANWAKVHYKLHWIQSLAAVRSIEVKFSNIPSHSAGFIPFARVEHAKFLTVDQRAAWVGTSNWSRDYFYSSRNISLFFDGEGAAQPLEKFFALGWDSPFAETVDPSGHYEPPKRQ